jgi:hypothetical protein
VASAVRVTSGIFGPDPLYQTFQTKCAGIIASHSPFSYCALFIFCSIVFVCLLPFSSFLFRVIWFFFAFLCLFNRFLRLSFTFLTACHCNLFLRLRFVSCFPSLTSVIFLICFSLLSSSLFLPFSLLDIQLTNAITFQAMIYQPFVSSNAYSHTLRRDAINYIHISWNSFSLCLLAHGSLERSRTDALVDLALMPLILYGQLSA